MLQFSFIIFGTKMFSDDDMLLLIFLRVAIKYVHNIYKTYVYCILKVFLSWIFFLNHECWSAKLWLKNFLTLQSMILGGALGNHFPFYLLVLFILIKSLLIFAFFITISERNCNKYSLLFNEKCSHSYCLLSNKENASHVYKSPSLYRKK